jgi:hypothetical protein
MSASEAPVLPRKRARRTTGGTALGQESSREAKKLAAAILEVLAGERTPTQAAEALSVSLPRYYQLEARGLRALLVSCEPRPRGRQQNPLGDVGALRRQNERLQRELTRQQSLVRLTQRAAGLAAPSTPAKEPGKKTRKRKPVARALTVAERLRQEVAATETSSGENGVSPRLE